MTSADVMNLVFSVAAVPVTGMLSGALYAVWNHFDKTATAQDKANMEKEIQAAIGSGLAAVQKDMPIMLAEGVMSPKLRTAILAQATNYFRTRFPDRAAQIASTVDATSPLPQALAIQQTIDARLSKVNLSTPLVALLGQGAGGSAGPAATTLAAPSV